MPIFLLPLVIAAIVAGSTGTGVAIGVGVHRFVNRTSTDYLVINDKWVRVEGAVAYYKEELKKAVKKNKITKERAE